MIQLFMHLWKSRDRQPVGSLAWWKAGAKRLQQLPNLLKQGWYHARLRRLGAQIHPMVFFSDARLISGRLEHLSVGEHSFIGRVELSVHEKLSIGRCVCINDGVKILTASHDVRDPLWRMVAKPVVIEDHVWIATNALILPGVTLGRGAVVGAGAVVTKDVPSLGIVAGNPARLLKEPRVPELNYCPTESLALFRAWLSR
ncbi:MAG: acyltransferase [Verrucomicrobiaceae bacterium]|nr:acyltransferase [Verrucomicrobiaceae bacterium]